MTLSEIKSRAHLNEVVSEYIELKASKSTGKWTASCPFHSEKTDSFNVKTNSSGEQYFYCFGCHAGGDVFSFVSKIKNVDFQLAVDIVCKKYGFKHEFSKEDREANERRDSDSKMMSSIYESLPALSKQGSDYIVNRGIFTALEDFPCRWTQDETSIIKKVKQVDPDNSLKLQTPWFWKTSLVFPVIVDGRFANLYFRNIEAQDKKDKHKMVGGRSKHLLFNKLEDGMFLVEGVFDLLSLVESGIKNTVCTFGNDLDDMQLKYLSRFEKCFIFFDNDENDSGIKGAVKTASQLAKAGVLARIVNLGSTGDPNELLQTGILQSLDSIKLKIHSYPPVKYKKLHNLEHSLIVDIKKGAKISYIFPDNFVNWKLENVDSDDARGSSCLLTALDMNYGVLTKDQVSFWSLSSRSKMARALRHLLHNIVEIGEIEKSIIDLDIELQHFLAEKNLTPLEETEETKEEFSKDEMDEAEELLNSPDIINRICIDLDKAGVVGEIWPKIISYLIMTSRKSNEPLSGCIKAQSSTGKSFIMNKIIQCCPKDEVFCITRATANALFYLKRDALKHKFFTMAELPGSEDSQYSIRVMQSERSLTLLRPFKNEETGEVETREITIDGPMAYFTTTVEVITSQENDTRNIDIYLNESEEQTRLIQDRQRYESTIEYMLDKDKIERIFKIHRAAQKLLDTYFITVPYANLLIFPSVWTRNRRDNMKFIELIKTVALLRQRKKEKKTHPVGSETVSYIEADLIDYEHAWQITSHVFEAAAEELTKQSRDMLTRIGDMCSKMIDNGKVRFVNGVIPLEPKRIDVLFGRADIRKYTRLPDPVIHKYIKPLERQEYLIIMDGGRGKPLQYRLNPDNPSPAVGMANKLMSPIELKLLLEGEPF